jgi:hypothetical protein
MAEVSNQLAVAVDLKPIRPTEVASVLLKVEGIEDLIAQRVGYWLSDGYRSVAWAAQL